MVKSLKNTRPQVLIFTDLDGTLLDRYTYEFSPAAPALEFIRSRRIPLILVSSKTRAEMGLLQQSLCPDDPFITENGGGIFFPPAFPLPKEYPHKTVDGYHMLFIGKPIEKVLEKVKHLRKDFAFRGFSEMSPKEIAEMTGLTEKQAVLAAQREFDEPVVLKDKENTAEIFCERASGLGLNCVEGGRFIHLFLGGNKGRAVELALAIYRQQRGAVFSIVLGDSPNDIPMLEIADKPVLMCDSNDVSVDGVIHPDLIKVEGGGPEAWNRVILDLLADML